MTSNAMHCGPMLRLRRGLLTLAALVGFGFTPAAHADFLEVFTQANARGGMADVGTDTASNVLGDSQAFADAFSAGPEAQGSAAGRAEAGSLGVLLHAEARTDTSAASVGARSVFRDVLLVTSSTLPLGTPVNLFFDLQPPPDEAFGTCSACFIGFVRARLDLVFGSAIRDNAVTWAQSVNGFGSYSGSFTSMLARVGDRVQLRGSLEGQLAVGDPTGAASFQIDLLTRCRSLPSR